MSAITGVINLNNQPIDKSYIDMLMSAYNYYSFDAIDTWLKDNVFLCCHAQWITPESLGEKLPYYDYDRQLVITADAIIDNRQELFSKLQIDRDVQKTIPDSKLILLAYEKWGEDAPKHLIGDFAFMIWDEKKQKLFGARDFSGARTLYYVNGEYQFAFSTTIKPLFSLPYISTKLNEEWLAEFIAIPSMVEAVDMSTTVYQSVFQVPPSHSITVENRKVSLKRYCKVFTGEQIRLKSNEEYEEAFREVLEEAVKCRIRTHGSVGSHLSGGLDSGSVVSFAARELKKQNKNIHTYSYIPEENFINWTPNYYISDETPFIKETVNYVGNIIDTYCDFKGKSPLNVIDDFLELMEMPYKFIENTFWLKGIYEVAEQNGIKVLLNGARGNHSISWGSLNLTYNYYSTLLKKLQLIRLNYELDSYCKNFRTGKSVMVPFIAKKAFPLLAQSVRKNDEGNQFQSFINPNLAKRTRVYEKLMSFGVNPKGGSVTDLSSYRRKYYDQLFPWNKSGVAGTNLSLKYSIWDRDPTNDIRVIRYCLAIPDEQYVTGGLERSLIRRSMKNLLPDKVRLNQNSRGIQGADVIHRMTSNWGSFICEIKQLSIDSRMSELLDMNVIKEAVKEYENQPRPEMVFEDSFKILTRSLILYRFMNKF
ncbi:asparagine synthase-related protein [Alkalihalobacterium chitinilyticum]|uniref:asparagine synthase (glutamine-hydrolyzing) n=1 Tax=Alkalihalobacterium chitinilyticum TaxID=2980103 RepID=A0ABT5VEB3_9BACI|nr:asparagine synthase-related protein [Alkalihalobacterium chitinilyticum]MDE5413810.1 asparagine synthase-related protein [Alkalihalobacterium chitinilyticum]